MHVAGKEVSGRGQVCVDCTLREVVWMVQESVLLFLCLHWYILHRPFSEEFQGKSHLCGWVFLWDKGFLGWFHMKISWREVLCSQL